MASEDFTTFTDFGRWIQWGIESTPENVSRTSTVVTFYGCNNGSTFLYKDYGVDYYQDFIHSLDVVQNSGENESIVFPWMLSNDIGDAKTLRDSSKDWIAIKFETVSGTHRMCLEESNAGSIYDSTPFIHGLTKRYLTITKSGVDFQVDVFNSSDDREANTNVQATLNLTLHSDYSFRYIYSGSSWFTDKNDNCMIKMAIENLVVGILPPDSITKYDGMIPSGLVSLSLPKVNFPASILTSYWVPPVNAGLRTNSPELKSLALIYAGTVSTK